MHNVLLYKRVSPLETTSDNPVLAATTLRTSDTRFRVVAVILGALLLVAAGLKVYGRDVSAVPRLRWFAAPWVQVAAAGWEVVLGLWLLSGTARRSAWGAAAVTFAVFAAVSGRGAWSGVATCGCLGAVEVDPAWMLALDVGVLVALAATRPTFTALPTEVGRRRETLPAGVVAVTAVAAVLGCGWYMAEMVPSRGMFAADFTDFGIVVAGETVTRSVVVRSRSDTAVSLVGGTSDCSCIVTDAPRTVPPWGAVEVTVTLKVPWEPLGRASRTIELYSNLPQQPRLRMSVGFVVVAAP